MGTINFPEGEFDEVVKEITGYKSGLALTTDQLIDHTPQKLREPWRLVKKGNPVRVRAETFDAIIGEILVKLGAAPPQAWENPMLRLAEFQEDLDADVATISRVGKIWGEWMTTSLSNREKSKRSKLDPAPFFEKARDECGKKGEEIAQKIICRIIEYQQASPSSHLRRWDWNDNLPLSDLFESESTDPTHGRYIDQRLIDYLHRNFRQIDEMNWRKFEGLVAEFLEQVGFDVELGPGRGDDGVDVRATFTGEEREQSLIIVQCKRQKESVGKTVMKGVHADVEWEGAEFGLLVTSNEVFPGTKEMARVRGYSVESVERAEIRQWITNLKSPNAPI